MVTMSEVIGVSNLFPYEIELAIKGLNNENRQKILTILLNKKKCSFSEIEKESSIESSLLANHLKELVKFLLVTHFYEHDTEEKYFSYYQISPYGLRILKSLQESLYIMTKETVEITLKYKRTRESTNAFGEKSINVEDKSFKSNDVTHQIALLTDLILEESAILKEE